MLETIGLSIVAATLYFLCGAGAVAIIAAVSHLQGNGWFIKPEKFSDKPRWNGDVWTVFVLWPFVLPIYLLIHVLGGFRKLAERGADNLIAKIDARQKALGRLK